MTAKIHRQQLNCIGCDSLRKFRGEMTCSKSVSFSGVVPEHPSCYGHTDRRTPHLVVAKPNDSDARGVNGDKPGTVSGLVDWPEQLWHEESFLTITRLLDTDDKYDLLEFLSDGLEQVFHGRMDSTNLDEVLTYVIQRGVNAIRAECKRGAQ